jgi:protein-disulfide isomerase
LGALAVWGLRGHRHGVTWPLGLSFWLALGYSAFGVALYLVSHLVIESVCVVCAGTYLVNFALAFVAFMALCRSGSGVLGGLRDDLRAAAAAPRPIVLLSGLLLLAVTVSWFAVPPYWRAETSTGPGGLAVGVTAEGHPWIGAAEPVLEVAEFSDYQCPWCQRGHGEVRKLIEEFRDTVRLVHRNYPLDQQCNTALPRPFHPHACGYALLAFCAQQQGRFWEANDYLFTHGRRSLRVTAEELATSVGLDAGELRSCAGGDRAHQSIQRDLEDGRSLRIRGTPTFVVNGETYPGRLPREVVEAALGIQQAGP